MRILVIGAGAVGGYFAGRLIAAGRDVTLLVRPGRADQLRQTGLVIKSPAGDLSLEPKLLLATGLKQSQEKFDLILLSTKSYSLDAAMEDFAPAIAPETAILPLLNGMQHLDRLVARFGEKPVMGGSTRIVSDLDSQGRVLHLEPLHDIVFGERDGNRTPRMAAITSEFHNAGFENKPSDNVLAFMWQKWVFLASLGAITCLMRGSIGAVAAVPGGADTARAILAECEAIGAANRYPTPPEFLEMVAKRLTLPGSPLTASMYRDLQRGNPVEADAILGDLIRRGHDHKVYAPLLQAAFAQLSVYSGMLAPI